MNATTQQDGGTVSLSLWERVGVMGPFLRSWSQFTISQSRRLSTTRNKSDLIRRHSSCVKRCRIPMW